MNQIVDAASLVSAVPLLAKPVMTKREKLLLWASAIREHAGNVAIYHRLEYWPQEALDSPHELMPYGAAHPTVMSIALNNPQMQAAGLSGNCIGDVMRFTELTQSNLHEFACDCGGMISNEDMARRIERLAS